MYLARELNVAEAREKLRDGYVGTAWLKRIETMKAAEGTDNWKEIKDMVMR